jgi:DNA-binding NtrC family response regulator
MKRARVLVVDDKANFLALFRRIMPQDIELVCAPDAKQAMAFVDAEPFDVVITDVRMPGQDGAALLEEVKRRSPNTQVILMTAYGTIPAAVAAMRAGAFDYLTKPFDPQDAVVLIEQAIGEARRQSVAASTELPYREVLAVSRDRTSREYLIAVLRDVFGNVTHAAERAGLERESLHRLMRRYGIRAEDFRKRT